MSVDMQFSTRRYKEDMAQPINPVLKCKEKMIKQLITQFRLSRQAQEKNWYQHGIIDYRAATEEWNSLCRDELLKPIIQRANMYPKTSQLVKDFHKELLRRRNVKKTLRQPVRVTGPHGVTHTEIASRKVIAMRQVIHQQKKQVSLVEAATVTTAFSHQISDQNGKGNGYAIVAHPADIPGASTRPRIIQLVQQHQHLQTPAGSNLKMPASSKKPKKEDALPPMRQRKARKSQQTVCAHYI
jgi:mannose/fructose-specific phosphotransferase system component IIA